MTGALLEHPEWLTATALALAAIGGALALAAARGRRRARALLGARAPRLAGAAMRDGVLAFALALVALALLGPRLGERSVEIVRGGTDVVLLVDGSRSMDVADVPPTRLDRATRLLGRLLARLEAGDRVALAAFAGRGVLFTPMTPDRDAIEAMLSALDSEMIAPGGSDLEAGLRAAVEAFPPGSDRPRVIVVASDGEHHPPDPAAASVHALRADARVVTVAIGSEAGGSVPDRGAPLLDRSGEPVVSRRNAETLAWLARATDGTAFVADDFGEVDVALVAAAVDRDAATGRDAPATRTLVAPLIAPFAAAAALLLWLESMPGPRVRRTRRSRSRAAGRAARALSALAMLVLVGADDALAPWPVDDDAAARRHFARARELAAARQRGDAERELLCAALLARDPDLAAFAWYGLGVLAGDAGDLERARDFYLDALALRPTDTAMRFNLEWTLGALAEQARQSERTADDDSSMRGDDPDDRAAPSPEPDGGGNPERADDDGAKSPSSTRVTRPDDPQRTDQSLVSGERVSGRPPPLDDDERARWLAAVSDDPAPAMRSIARSDRATQERSASSPSW